MTASPVTHPFCGACGNHPPSQQMTNDATKCEACGASLREFHGFASAGTAGIPGSFDGGLPYDIDELFRMGIVGDPSTPWTTGQYVKLGNGDSVYWDGTKWQIGTAP